MTRILSTAIGFPPHYYSQEELVRALREVWAQRYFNLERLEQLHRNVLVGGRHLALPPEEYLRRTGFGDRNDAWIAVALDLGEEVIRKLLASARLEPGDISALVFTTVTGLAVPSLEARLMNRIAFRSDLKRVPLFGLGCLAGAAGVARVADYLRGHPAEAALLLSVELCSLTIQLEDLSVANLVSSGLFGDGAAAVLMVGSQHPAAAAGPVVVDSRSVFFPDSERVMGWDVCNTGFRVVLGPEVPDYALKVGPALESFLEDHGLALSDIDHWIAHPGGPKVIDAMEQALGLGPGALDLSRRSLAEVGNVSSASVLFVLDDFLRTRRPEEGSYGIMMAMGPAFCAELLLLRW
ncbi:MAG: type III polyketide synthase [Armatimonadetes bacterium]|nr:type III polyketide synthase [Armatimonadota bacterium]